MEKAGACAFSVYQALSPPLKGPGDEVMSVSDHAVCTQLSKLTSVSKCQVDSVESL